MRRDESRAARRPRLAAALAVAAALLTGIALTLSPAAVGRTAGNPVLNIDFFANGTITVSLPDGTAVGTTSGAPTVIPGGYYQIVILGPGGCAQLPLFDLQGPGEHLVDDMSGGEVTSESYQAYFAPNSTFTWRTDNANPPTVYTFQTSSVVVGTSPTKSVLNTGTGPAPTGKPNTSLGIVGSAIVPFRGTLTGVVNARGRLSLSFEGKAVKKLKAGRYTIRVVDRSALGGFVLEKGTHPKLTVTAGRYVGTHSASVQLTAGRWLFAPGGQGKKLAVLVTAA